MRIYRGIVRSIKIIFENLGKLLKIEIVFGREPKIRSKMDIFKK